MSVHSIDSIECEYCCFFFCKQKTGYDMRISDWSSDVCSSDLASMRGEIPDFKESLRRRLALLRGVPESALETVFDERLALNPGAERLIEVAQASDRKSDV